MIWTQARALFWHRTSCRIDCWTCRRAGSTTSAPTVPSTLIPSHWAMRSTMGSPSRSGWSRRWSPSPTLMMSPSVFATSLGPSPRLAVSPCFFFSTPNTHVFPINIHQNSFSIYSDLIHLNKFHILNFKYFTILGKKSTIPMLNLPFKSSQRFDLEIDAVFQWNISL